MVRIEWSRRLLAPLAAVFAACFLAKLCHDFNVYNTWPQACYEPQGVVPTYDRVHMSGRTAQRYKLYHYTAQGGDKSLKGVPVLFVPGNAGSFRQGTPIASYFDGPEHDKDEGPFDFFMADFADDLTAFYGDTLLDQAEFVNDAVWHILDLYGDKGDTGPSAVILLAHSMGGIVARTVFTLPNYVDGSVNTVITLSSPHAVAPVSFDAGVVQIYDRVNQYWRRAAALDGTNLSNVTLISVAGGQNDRMVPSDYTMVEGLVRPTHGFTAFTYAMPFVWTSIDHLAIMWCGQFRRVLAQALEQIVDPTVPERTVSVARRMRVFERWLLPGPHGRNARRTQSLISVDKQLAQGPEPTMITSSGHVDWVVPVTPDAKEEGLVLWANVSRAADFYTCHGQRSADISEAVCRDISHKIVYLPDKGPRDLLQEGGSMAAGAYSPRVQTAYVTPNDVEKDTFVLVRVKRAQSGDGAVMSSLPYQYEIQGSAWDLWRDRRSAAFDSGYARIAVKSARSSLVAYNVELSVSSFCQVPDDESIVLRQYIQEPQQSRTFHFKRRRTITTSTNGMSPFVPYNTSLASDNYLRLDVFVPNLVCDEPKYGQFGEPHVVVTVSMNLSATMANLVLRYRALFLSFMVGLVAVVLSAQFSVYATRGSFPSAAKTTQALCGLPAIAISVVLVVLHFMLLNEGVRDFFRALQLYPSETSTVRALHEFAPEFTVHDIFLGINDATLWFLGPVFLYVALGVLWIVQVPLFDGIIIQGAQYLYMRFAKTTSPAETERVQPRTRIAVITIATILISLVIPVQTCIIVCCIWQLITAICATLTPPSSTLPLPVSEAPTTITKDHRLSSNYSNYCVSLLLLLACVAGISGPTVAVWLHNLRLTWALRSPSALNSFHAIGIILEVEACSRDKTVPHFHHRLSRSIALAFLIWFSAYSFLYGVSHLFVLPRLANLYCLSAVGSRYLGARDTDNPTTVIKRE